MSGHGQEKQGGTNLPYLSQTQRGKEGEKFQREKRATPGQPEALGAFLGTVGVRMKG